MDTPFYSVSEVGRDVWQLTDVLLGKSYLVCGQGRALLVDAGCGFGNIREVVETLTDLPVTVAFTHGHYDHVAGGCWFEEALIAAEDERLVSLAYEHAFRVLPQVISEGLVTQDTPFGPRDGRRCRLAFLSDKDVFDLGGRTVRVVGLRGHTQGSLGYLVEDERLLLSGDAVTPIMCLFFNESCDIEGWAQTLEAMDALEFDHFMTGHHDRVFKKSDLASFMDAARFAQQDRGVYYQHARLDEYRGVMHFCPCKVDDADSPDFRAVIERWHELVPRKSKGRRARKRGAAKARDV